MNYDKARRYLTEALKLSYGCTSATCEVNKQDGGCGTANLCRCKYAFKTMINAVSQMIEKDGE